mmetsp:Transcript_8323/g.16940  ORF Transcript_8323/g.16940 Transcript_8323/m.16940 type:complete len:1580 (-) Transcript_8323:60-4799(-)
MGTELISVLALGEAREVLAALRRNQRFSTWTQSFMEHRLVMELKGVKDIVRAGSVSGKLDVRLVLSPFLEVARSPEAGSGIITAAALSAVEKVIKLGIADETASLAHAANALEDVIAAVSECRFDSTDAAVDEKVLALICKIVVSCLSCGRWARSLSDHSLLLAFETVLRILGGRRRSELLKSLVRQTLCDIIFILVRGVEERTATEPTSDSINDWHRELSLLNEPGDPIFDELQIHGLQTFSFDVVNPSNEPNFSTFSLECILRLASYLIDPLLTKNRPAERQLGYAFLNAAICGAPSSAIAPLMNVRSIRRVLLRQTSRAILRGLGSRLNSLADASIAFATALNLLHALGPYGGPLLTALFQKVFPPMVSGVCPDGSGKHIPLDEGVREIGLEALGAIFAQPGLLALAYASIDCSSLHLDAVEPLLNSLQSMIERDDALWRKERVALLNRGVDDEEEDENDLRASRAAVLLSADILIGAIDSISDRVKMVTPSASLAARNSNHAKGVSIASVGSLREKKLHKKHLQTLCGSFNANQGKKGARALVALLEGVEIGDLETVSEDKIREAVQFLRNTPGLDKASIGTVLGEGDALSQSLLTAYAASFDFAGRSFTAALRVYLESFRLPGEGQKVDRFVEQFAMNYFTQNKPEDDSTDSLVLKSSDVAHILAFSVVMLNTDLHNESVKKKMSFEDFVRNCRGINEGEDIPKNYLRTIFDSIAAVEIKLSNEAGIDRLTDIYWDEQLRTAGFLAFSPVENPLTRETASLLSFPDDAKMFDEEVFRLCWKPTLTAAVVALEEALDPETAQKALEGFLSIARCASSFRMPPPINACISALSMATHILDGELNGAIVRFGTSVKAQMATVALLGVARQCGDWLRNPGWQLLVDCILRLHVLGLLPDEVEVRLLGFGDDLVGLDGKPIPTSRLLPQWWPGVRASSVKAISEGSLEEPKPRRKPSGFLNAVGGFLRVGAPQKGSPEDDDADHVIDICGSQVRISRAPPSYLRLDRKEELDARNLARKCIADCRVEDIIVSETRFLRTEALSCLAQDFSIALRRALDGRLWVESDDDEVDQELSEKIRKLSRSPREMPVRSVSEENNHLDEGLDSALAPPRVDSSWNSQTDREPTSRSEKDDTKTAECVAAFCVNALCEMTLHNRDRLATIWPHTKDSLTFVISSATEPTVLLERAVIALLKIGSRFLHREEVRGDVLRTLNLIVKLPTTVVGAVSSPVGAGVYQMVKAHSVFITGTSDWHAILNLIEGCARYPEPTRSLGLESLKFLLSGEICWHVLTRETFAPFLDAASAYLPSPLPAAMAALDLVFLLSSRISDPAKSLFKAVEARADDQDGESGMWKEVWSPLLRVFADAARDSRLEMRNYSLILLEKMVATGRGDEVLSPTDWRLVFSTVIFPLIRESFTGSTPTHSPRDISSPEDMRKAKLRLIILLSKTFLQQHAAMARALSSDTFVQVWQGVLESFKLALNTCSAPNVVTLGEGPEQPADDGSAEIREHVPESLKNIVLVMAAEGILVRGDNSLWQSTSLAVSDVVPDLDEVIARCGPTSGSQSQAATSAEPIASTIDAQ